AKLLALGAGHSIGTLALIAIGLGKPITDGLCRGLKLLGQVIGSSPCSHQGNNLPAKLRRVWRSRLRQDGQLLFQGLRVPEIGSTPAATAQNSLYALDANTGVQLWSRHFGADFGGCQPPGGSGIRSVPVVDRSVGRIYVVTDDGVLRSLSLADGTDAAATLAIIDLPATNKVRGGLNLFHN